MTGRILDRRGKPVEGVYAFARRNRNDKGLPDFISPWTDAEGRYSLCLPPGTFFLGGSLKYPPEDGVSVTELLVDANQIDVADDVWLNDTAGTKEEGDHGSGETD